MTAIRTIWCKGQEGGHHDEGLLATAATGVYPGMAIEKTSAGEYDQVAATPAEYLKRDLNIVLEDALQGKTINDIYTAASQVFFGVPKKGDHVLALVKSGEAIALRDKLKAEGSGSGLFIECAGSESRYTLEALEAPGTLAANTLVLCEVL